MLKSYALNINKINLSNLIKGLPFTVLCTLVKNRIRIDINILADTKANRVAFIDIALAN